MKKILLITLLTLLSLTLTACNGLGVTFELDGPIYVNLELGTSYADSGYTATSGLKNIEDYVTVSSNINSDEPGDYQITYTLDYEDTQETLTRFIYYRNDGCELVLETVDNVVQPTNLTKCQVQYLSYLDTYFNLAYYYEDDLYHTEFETITNTIENILKTYHELSNKYESYDGITNIYTINENPTTPHVIDQKLFDLITFSLEHQQEVDNLFNIALGPVINIWGDYRDNCLDNNICALPTNEELFDSNLNINPDNIVLDTDTNTITLQPNMSLDLGGISKGYITGIITDYLNELSLHGYLINNGNSNISVGGKHPTRDNEQFMIAIEHPNPTDATNPHYATMFVSDNEHVVTSGDTQKYFIVDSEIYHHIVNNNTRYPERYSRSVTIVTDDPALGDLYSTALFMMTVEDGLEFVNSRPNLEAIWYNLDDTVTFSENFETRYLNELTN
jgi:thiamine biosynthesis lipoprotein